MAFNKTKLTEVYSFSDAYGQVFIVDQNRIRRLYFDEHQQSCMLIDSPNQLIAPYEAIMACWQFFQNVDHGHLLQLGLGGASSTKYCLAHYAGWQVSVVEIRERLVGVVQEYFLLTQDKRLTIYIDDALQFVAQLAKDAVNIYQVLIVDLFDLTQLSTYAYSEVFLQQCLQLMPLDGVMVLNLWRTDTAAFKTVLARIGHVFAWRLLIYPVDESDNVVVFVFHPAGKRHDINQLKKRSQVLTDAELIDFNVHLQAILQHNQQHLHRVIDMP